MHNGVLTDSDKTAHNLDRDGLYVFKFLFNGTQNKAADPSPFKLSNLDTLAKKSLGRPFIVPKWGETKHVRSTKDTVEDQLAIQAKYSVGEIVDYTKSNSGNYYGIIKIWPEYEGMVRNNLIPDFTSPTIYVNQRDNTGQITDAEFLNVQAVPVPGYQPEYAGINGLCDGTKDTCMTELRTLAAAGQLSMIRQNDKLFSNMLARIKGAMSMEAPQAGQGQASNSDITKALEGLQGMVKGNTEALESIGGRLKAHGEVLMSLAENVEGVDFEAVREKLGGGAESPKPEAGAATIGAAGDDKKEDKKETEKTAPKRITSKDKQIEELIRRDKEHAREIEELKKERELERAEVAKQKRLAQAHAIVDNLVNLKYIPPTEKEKKVQYYNELKDESDKLVDLTLYASELKALKPNIVASAGDMALYRLPMPKTESANAGADRLREFGII